MRSLGLVVALAGCSFTLPAARSDVDGDTATPDVVLPDVPPGDVCYGTGAVTVCLASAPSVPMTLPSVIDTGSAICQDYDSADTPNMCLIAGSAIAGSGAVRVTGTRPLIVLAADAIVLDDTTVIDVGSHITTGLGAGANAGACTPPTPPTMGGTTSGGGAGGSFGDVGGGGGAGETDGLGGIASAAAPTDHLRGGCAGDGGAGGSAGAGGAGGGAIYLIAKSAIDIEGTINASGAGGIAGTTASSGGGGGGSGGMVGLDAPTLTVGSIAMVFANGGGGGQGSGATTPGGNGGESAGPMLAGVGGVGATTYGGHGGDGSFGTTTSGAVGLPGTGGTGVGAGGGGGGGAGVIVVVGPTVTNGNVAPPPRS